MMTRLKALMASHPRLMEMARFALTGGVCFVAEFACLTLLVEWLHVPVLWATAIAFLLSVALNYVLCVRWVFSGAQDGGARVKATFLFTSGVGFGLNELFMWLMTGPLAIHYMIAKVVSTLLVMVWNYITKRLVLRPRASQEGQK